MSETERHDGSTFKAGQVEGATIGASEVPETGTPGHEIDNIFNVTQQALGGSGTFLNNAPSVRPDAGEFAVPEVAGVGRSANQEAMAQNVKAARGKQAGEASSEPSTASEAEGPSFIASAAKEAAEGTKEHDHVPTAKEEALTLLDALKATETNPVSKEEFDGLARAFKKVCLEVINSSDKNLLKKREDTAEMLRYVKHYRETNLGIKSKAVGAKVAPEATKAAAADKSAPKDAVVKAAKAGLKSYPIDTAKREARRKLREEGSPSKGGGLKAAERAADLRMKEVAAERAKVAADRAGEEALGERMVKIMDRQNSAEVSALNDRAELEIYGSRGRTYVNPKGEAMPPQKGKIEEIRENRRFGTKPEDRESVARKYEEDVNKLLGEGFELAQVKLIMDLRERDVDARAGTIGKFIAQGLDPSTATEKADKLYAKLDANRKNLVRDEGIFTAEEYLKVSGGIAGKTGNDVYKRERVDLYAEPTEAEAKKLTPQQEKSFEIHRKISSAIERYKKAKAEGNDADQAAAQAEIIAGYGELKENWGDLWTDEVNQRFRQKKAKEMGENVDSADIKAMFDAMDAAKANKALSPEERKAKLQELSKQFTDALKAKDDKQLEKLSAEAYELLKDDFRNAKGDVNDMDHFKAWLAWHSEAGDKMTTEKRLPLIERLKMDAWKAKNVNDANKFKKRARMVLKQAGEDAGWNEADIKKANADLEAYLVKRPDWREKINYKLSNKEKSTEKKKIWGWIAVGGLVVAALVGIQDHGSRDEVPGGGGTTTSSSSTLPGGGAGGPTTTTGPGGAGGTGGGIPGNPGSTASGVLGAGGNGNLLGSFPIEAGHGYTQEIQDALPGFSADQYLAAHNAAVAKFGPDYLQGVPKYTTDRGELRLGRSGTGNWSPEVIKFIQDTLKTQR